MSTRFSPSGRVYYARVSPLTLLACATQQQQREVARLACTVSDVRAVALFASRPSRTRDESLWGVALRIDRALRREVRLTLKRALCAAGWKIYKMPDAMAERAVRLVSPRHGNAGRSCASRTQGG